MGRLDAASRDRAAHRAAVRHVDVVAGSDGPGLLVLADDLSVVATTPAAERWLAELADWPRRSELPQAIYG